MAIQDGINDLLNSNNAFINGLGQIYALQSQSALADAQRRIFHEGKDSDENPIGQYSTEPIYVGETSFLTKAGANRVLGSKAKRKRLYDAARGAGRLPAFRPKGADRAVIYFTDGYKGIRDADGRQTRFVDLNYSGRLRISFQAEVTQDGFILGFSNPLDGTKMAGNEERFKTRISELSNTEIERVVQGLVSELIRKFDDGLS